MMDAKNLFIQFHCFRLSHSFLQRIFCQVLRGKLIGLYHIPKYFFHFIFGNDSFGNTVIVLHNRPQKYKISENRMTLIAYPVYTC